MSEDKTQKQVSTSILKKRWKKFKTLKRGYYSFIVILILYAVSFILPLFIGKDALIVNYKGEYFFSDL